MPIIFRLTCFICLLLSSLTPRAQQVAKQMPYAASPDGIIGFLEFKPADYTKGLHPLIIFLHGWGERGNGSSQLHLVTASGIPQYCAHGASMQFTVAGQRSSFIVLSPQLSRQYGAWPVDYVVKMIDYAKQNLRVDTTRIYVTGLSLGGGGTWAAITTSTRLTTMIAAAAPVCGTQDMIDSNFCATIGASHLPVWAFHSLDDKTVLVNATQHAEALANNCQLSPAMKLSYYPSGGHMYAWLKAYDTGHATVKIKGKPATPKQLNLYEWLLSNATGAGTRKRLDIFASKNQ